MEEKKSNNIRIAKNSILLYIRLAVVMAGGLFISRVILDQLGASDYGLYNVVGGFVMTFTVVTSSLTAATSRFITFELGTSNLERLKTVFSLSVSIHIIISIILFVFLETFGIWYLNEKMVIEPDRHIAANYVFHLSVISLIFNLLNIPYNAALMAHEHMDSYAYISILEILLKMMVCFVLPYIQYDSLIMYAFLIMLISIVIRIAYIWYCKKHFVECSYKIRKDNGLLKAIFVFSGWNFIGAASSILKSQGTNIVLNLFFGTIVNAAYGLSIQVASAVNNFSTGVQNAINPQIIKQYSIKNMDYMYRLVFYGSRASFYLMMLVFIPVFLNTNDVLSLWLKEIPIYTTVFLQLALITSMIDTWSGPLITAMLATGDIRTYQIVVGGADIMCLPLSYIFLKNGMPPYLVFIVILCISVVTLILRLTMLKRMICLPSKSFLLSIVGKTSFVCILTLLTSYKLCVNVVFDDVILQVLIRSVICFVISIILIFLMDTSKQERQLIYSFLSKRINNDKS